MSMRSHVSPQSRMLDFMKCMMCCAIIEQNCQPNLIHQQTAIEILTVC